MVNRTPTVNG